MLGQYLLENEKDYNYMQKEPFLIPKDSVTLYWKLKIFYWVCFLCFFSLEEHFKYVLVLSSWLFCVYNYNN